MKGKELTIQEVAKLDNRSRVYVERYGRVTLELVAKTAYSSVVRTLAYGATSDNFEAITAENKYFAYEPGVNLGEIPEITFDVIRYAVAACKHNNDVNQKIGNPPLYPGIDEAYDLLNAIAAKGEKR